MQKKVHDVVVGRIVPSPLAHFPEHEHEKNSLHGKKFPVGKEKGAQVTSVESLGAMLLSTLGCTDSRLYLFSESATDSLLGVDLKGNRQQAQRWWIARG